MSKLVFMRNKSGQVALLLIFISAVALILYAMAANVTKLSRSKLAVTIAGNTAAASLASRMASYGENVMQTQLGGKREKCNHTSLFSAIISFILVVVIVVAMIATGQFQAMGALAQVATISTVVLAAAGVVIQAVYIQPMITKMWNKMQAQISTTEDAFLESALQTGLQKVITDSVKIRDFYDYDMDTRIAKPRGPYDTSDPNTWPTAQRFVFYYTERLKSYRNLSLMGAGQFITSVNNLLVGLGIDTRLSCCSGTINAEFCDNCCVLKDIRSTTCHSSIADRELFPDIPSQCLAGPLPGYPLSYDRFFCNRLDSTTLPALLGLDDSSKTLKKIDILSPSSNQVVDNDGGASEIFRGEDSSGTLFPLLWLARDGEVNIHDLTTTAAAVSADTRNCHWCAAGGGVAPCSSADAKATYRFWYYPVTRAPYGQLVLSHPCTGDGCCTNRFISDPYYTTFTLDTRIIDSVGSFNTTINGTTYGNGLFDLAPPPAQCPGDPASSASAGYWRTGSDDLCSTTAPYYMGTEASGLCTKYVGMTNCLNMTTSGPAATCQCIDAQSTHRDSWFDDSFDELIIWLRSVAANVEGVIAPNGVPTTPQKIADSLDTWRDGAMTILNEIDGCSGCTCDGNGHCVNSGSCSGGRYAQLVALQQLFNEWLAKDYKDTAAGLWCLPNDPTFLPTDEYNFVMNGGSAYGSIRSVLNCLQYNSNIVSKLQACKAYCDANPTGNSATECQKLPRSLLLPAGSRDNVAYDLNAIYSLAGGGGCGQTATATINGASVTLPFSDIISLSLRLAYDLEAKMDKRHEYLYNMYEYVRTLSERLNILKDAIGTAPVQRVKDAICLISDGKNNARIENLVYYGWCTGWDTGDALCQHSGTWHLVRVEAWLPKRCDGWGGCCTNAFPWVKTEKRGTTKRCYFMQEHSGRVRTRVLRYDGPPVSTGGMIKFANGFPLWQFRSGNPYVATNGVNLSSCESEDSLFSNIAPGAFMINGTEQMAQKTAACRDAITSALSQSVGNETCAYYYLSGNAYRIRFGRCDDACAYDPNAKD